MSREYPFIIGITGHRDPVAEDSEFLRAQISAVFSAVGSACGDVPVKVMTSLAEGADQICARIALEMGFGLITVLPLETEELETDFSGEALEEFRSLMAASEEVFVSPDVENGDPEPAVVKLLGRDVAGRDSGPWQRRYRYRQAGLYITQRCQLLLSLWDGQEDASGCGTAAVMAYAGREWSHDGENFAYDPSVTVIPMRRRSGPDKAPEAEAVTQAELKKISGEVALYAEHVRELNLRTRSGNGPESGEDAANILAVEYREKYRNAMWWVAVCNVAAVLLFMLYDVFEIRWATILTLIAVAASFVLQALTGGKGTNYLNKYIDYRALAETNRVQAFLTDAGSSRIAADFYTVFQKNMLPWVEQAARAAVPGGTGKTGADSDTLRRRWCLGQYAYHRNALKRDVSRLEKQELFTRSAAVISAAIYLALMAVEYVLNRGTGSSTDIIRILKVVLAFATAVSVFASDFYAGQKLDWKCSDSERMADLYAKADAEWQRLDEEGSSKEDLVLMLARAEIVENGNWVASQRK